jgi:peroxiredoxin
VLFFCPKDDTPGCTIECKELRDAAPKFEGKKKHGPNGLGI